MKTVKKNVYYCDFCSKRKLAKWSMVKHEIVCTANPNRICGLCDGNNIIELAEQFKNRIEVTETNPDGIFTIMGINFIGEPFTVEDIRKSVDYCPNCTLSVMRQAGFCHGWFSGDLEYDYKADFNQWMKEHNSLRFSKMIEQERDSYYV
jgi:hypothetical protein